MDPNEFRDSPAGRLVRTPGEFGYWAFMPHPLPPEVRWTSDLVMTLSEADRALGQLAGMGRSLLNPHLLIRPFMHREAVLSSRIEGTRASLSDLYAFEAVQLEMFEPTSDVREVYNYVQALQHALTRLSTLPLSSRLLRETHARLMEGVRGEEQTPGEFRTRQNWIGPPGCTLENAPFVPPPVHEMHDALSAFEEYLHSPSGYPPLVRLGLIHYQFEAIHPFLDGNGRIGRLLITLILCAWGILPDPLLYLSAYFESQRQTYYDLLLAVSQRGAWEEWLTFFLRGVATQAHDGVTRIRRLQDLRAQYRARFQTTRIAANLLKVVDLLFAQPVLTVRHVEQTLDVHFATAQRYIDQLEEEGILDEITGQTRNRIYRANAVLQAIEQPL